MSTHFAWLLILIPAFVPAQPSSDLDASIEMHLRFLSADELMGRRTGEAGNRVAAKYIAEQLRRVGVKPGASNSSFHQSIIFERSVPPSSGSVTIDDQVFEHGSDALVLRGAEVDGGRLVFVNYAWQDDDHDDFSEVDVEGKYVLSLLGRPGSNDVQEALGLVREKRRILKEKGALGLVEIYRGQFPWNYLRPYLNSEQMILKEPGEQDDPDFSYVLLGPEIGFNVNDFQMGKEMTVSILREGLMRLTAQSSNVIGLLEGTDAQLKKEYVVVSAHYDHVGVGTADATGDTIRNGARDNAIGVASVLAAAEWLVANPPKRSVVFIGFTGEEIGLLGSEYYINHPVIPLDQTVFNLNCDGAGYHDTTIVSVMGLNRVGAAEEMTAAAEAYGFGIFADPAPEQNLFDRSDNVNFARVGIPAPTFTLGVREFNAEISKYYHQPSDEFESLNLNYVTKFVKSFALAAQLIANKEEQPRWRAGDKYEPAFKELFGEN